MQVPGETAGHRHGGVRIRGASRGSGRCRDSLRVDPHLTPLLLDRNRALLGPGPQGGPGTLYGEVLAVGREAGAW
ncbi:hypothetical protein FM106_30725 [Brachybacterium faecium]|nr:hypothetical protein FM106_30725 [Brachybacterium faecium]